MLIQEGLKMADWNKKLREERQGRASKQDFEGLLCSLCQDRRIRPEYLLQASPMQPATLV